MYGWRVRAYANSLKLLSQRVIPVEEDILLGRKGAQYVSYLSSGMDYGVHAADVGSGQILEIQKTGNELGQDLLFISLPLKGTNCHYSLM